MTSLRSNQNSPTFTPHLETDQYIIRLWDEISWAAVQENASDIHIEAQDHCCVIRFRVRGDLYLFKKYPKIDHSRLIARIKILAKLDIAEQRLPQDGRLIIQHHNPSSIQIDCRVSSIPTLYGEKIVIRLLNTSTEELNIDQIGFTDFQIKTVKESLQRKSGLILVCGPTGSGKTRTLYSFLQFLNQPHLNLCSIEDPIEIRMKGVNQVAYHPKAGLNFGLIIRALLRQDPDVMLIGEIRDHDTAALAITAAQTGHLVLSTIHTRNAISCIERLRNLGIESHSIAESILFISSQRLVKDIRDLERPKRVAIHEVLVFSQILRSAIQKNLGFDELELIAKKDGFVSMQESAQLLVDAYAIDDESIKYEIS